MKLLYPVLLMAVVMTACKKDKPKPPPYYPPRHVMYLVKGTHIKLNFIDSTGGFLRDQLYTDSFRYEFWRTPGTNIGMSVGIAALSDVIYGWEIRVDGKLRANAFSTGGAYMAVPFD
jgi:hypothetical protein